MLALVALVFAWIFYKEVASADPGDEEMQEIAGYVRDGAMAYLKRQYKVVAIFFVVRQSPCWRSWPSACTCRTSWSRSPS